MLDRSIPLYGELQRQISELCAEFSQPDTNIYDLGCSTGITMENIRRSVSDSVKIIGFDYSGAMLNKARQRFEGQLEGAPVEFIEADLNSPIEIKNASVVVLNLTLQFIRPLYRDSLVKAVYEGLNDKGRPILFRWRCNELWLLLSIFGYLFLPARAEHG
jgi:tRNA (cmo5U34)-methyltransferase